MRVSAQDYAKQIGKSISTARRRLEQMVHAGKARRITTYSEWHNPFPGRNGQMFGTVPAIEYDVTEVTLPPGSGVT